MMRPSLSEQQRLLFASVAITSARDSAQDAWVLLLGGGVEPFEVGQAMTNLDAAIEALERAKHHLVYWVRAEEDDDE